MASLTSLLARVFGIALPHPIILNAEHSELESTCDATEVGNVLAQKEVLQRKDDFSGNTPNDKSHLPLSSHKSTEQQPSSFAKTSWLVGSSLSSATTKIATAAISGVGNAVVGGVKILKNSAPSVPLPYAEIPFSGVFDRARQHYISGSENSPLASEETKNMKSISTSQRIKHATSAIIKEERSNNPKFNSADDNVAKFELEPPCLKNVTDDSGCSSFEYEKDVHTCRQQEDERCNNNVNNIDKLEEFHTGLQLLQNNIVSLCIHVGVPVDTLYPAEAILLNLESLKVFSREETIRLCNQ